MRKSKECHARYLMSGMEKCVKFTKPPQKSLLGGLFKSKKHKDYVECSHFTSKGECKLKVIGEWDGN